MLELIVLRERDISAISSPRKSIDQVWRNSTIRVSLDRAAVAASRDQQPERNQDSQTIRDGRMELFAIAGDVNTSPVNGRDKASLANFSYYGHALSLLNGTYRGRFKTAKIPDKRKLFFDRTFATVDDANRREEFLDRVKGKCLKVTFASITIFLFLSAKGDSQFPPFAFSVNFTEITQCKVTNTRFAE